MLGLGVSFVPIKRRQKRKKGIGDEEVANKEKGQTKMRENRGRKGRKNVENFLGRT